MSYSENRWRSDDLCIFSVNKLDFKYKLLCNLDPLLLCSRKKKSLGMLHLPHYSKHTTIWFMAYCLLLIKFPNIYAKLQRWLHQHTIIS